MSPIWVFNDKYHALFDTYKKLNEVTSHEQVAREYQSRNDLMLSKWRSWEIDAADSVKQRVVV